MATAWEVFQQTQKLDQNKTRQGLAVEVKEFKSRKAFFKSSSSHEVGEMERQSRVRCFAHAVGLL